ncbi:hypothetical protein TNCV_694071 [Trichonephila clavipes]|nr:hypothetical protein TNCV_694071 [Trichonephila clavipes]
MLVQMLRSSPQSVTKPPVLNSQEQACSTFVALSEIPKSCAALDSECPVPGTLPFWVRQIEAHKTHVALWTE